MSDRFTLPEMVGHAISGVEKINRHGARGTTLCNMLEIEAMACLIVSIPGLLPQLAQAYPPSEEDKSNV